MKVIVGTRGSALARAQTQAVLDQLKQVEPTVEFRLHCLQTTGDRLVDLPTADLPTGKGVFTREIEEALYRHDIDVAVHSLKDLPTQMPEGLSLAAIPQREDPHDVFLARTDSIGGEVVEKVKKEGKRLLFPSLPSGTQVATGSSRRCQQILRLNPQLKMIDLRGNIDTRLKKLRTHTEWVGIILAAAGINRLRPDLSGLSWSPIDFQDMLPAPGQGALALQIREKDTALASLLARIHHPETEAHVLAERAFLSGLGGGCEWPIGAYAHNSQGKLHLEGIYWKTKELHPRKGFIQGPHIKAQALGSQLASQLNEAPLSFDSSKVSI